MNRRFATILMLLFLILIVVVGTSIWEYGKKEKAPSESPAKSSQTIRVQKLQGTPAPFVEDVKQSRKILDAYYMAHGEVYKMASISTDNPEAEKGEEFRKHETAYLSYVSEYNDEAAKADPRLLQKYKIPVSLPKDPHEISISGED